MPKQSTITQRRREREKAQRREHILDCAEDLVIRDGLDGLSIDAVAKEAELAKGTLYLYFKNKEAILEHLTIRVRVYLLKKFHEEADLHENPLDKLKGILLLTHRMHNESGLYSHLMAFDQHNHRLFESKELAQASKNITAFVVSLIDQGKAQGLIRQDVHAANFAYIMWGTSVGMTQMVEARQEVIKGEAHQSADSIFHDYAHFFIQGIKA
jgi:AcrR family transcriptional regulator